MSFADIEAALRDIARGRMVILVDDEDRENEGDLVMAAEHVTAQAINFMATHARGLICLTLTEARLRALDIPLMVVDNASPHQTAFTVSIEARDGVTTGISAADRARTVQVALDEASTPAHLTRPGHIFPLRAKPGGVLSRIGHTEGSVDLARLAGCKPAGVICEVVNADGTMARRPDLERFGAHHDMPVISIADLVRYRLAKDVRVLQRYVRHLTHPEHGALKVHLFETPHDGRRHVVVRRYGASSGVPRVCVQGAQSLSFVLGWLERPGHAASEAAFSAVWPKGHGLGDAMLVCIDTLGDKAGLKVRLEALEQSALAQKVGDAALDAAAHRDGIGAHILRSLDVSSVRLVGPEPGQAQALTSFGLQVEAADVGKASLKRPHLLGDAS